MKTLEMTNDFILIEFTVFLKSMGSKTYINHKKDTWKNVFGARKSEFPLSLKKMQHTNNRKGPPTTTQPNAPPPPQPYEMITQGL